MPPPPPCCARCRTFITTAPITSPSTSAIAELTPMMRMMILRLLFPGGGFEGCCVSSLIVSPVELAESIETKEARVLRNGLPFAWSVCEQIFERAHLHGRILRAGVIDEQRL